MYILCEVVHFYPHIQGRLTKMCLKQISCSIWKGKAFPNYSLFIPFFINLIWEKAHCEKIVRNWRCRNYADEVNTSLTAQPERNTLLYTKECYCCQDFSLNNLLFSSFYCKFDLRILPRLLSIFETYMTTKNKNK